MADKILIKGWVAVTNKGKGTVVPQLDNGGPFFARREHGWTDDTRWVRATAEITLHPSIKMSKAQK